MLIFIKYTPYSYDLSISLLLSINISDVIKDFKIDIMLFFLIQENGIEVIEDDELEGANRFFTSDPFGNRLEFIEWL